MGTRKSIGNISNSGGMSIVAKVCLSGIALATTLLLVGCWGGISPILEDYNSRFAWGGGTDVGGGSDTAPQQPIKFGPVGFSDEVILIKLTDSTVKPQWTEQDSMVKASEGTNLTPPNIPGFGKLEEGDYVLSLPVEQDSSYWGWAWKDMWLHVSVGTMVDGTFKEGFLIDEVTNKPQKVTSLKFSFLTFQGRAYTALTPQRGAPNGENKNGSYAYAQIEYAGTTNRTAFDAFMVTRGSLRTQFKVEVIVCDEETGHTRTLDLVIKDFGIKMSGYNQFLFKKASEMFQGQFY